MTILVRLKLETISKKFVIDLQYMKKIRFKVRLYDRWKLLRWND